MSLTAPRRTEYQGVIFRSKSEALFARLLELNGYEWMYEPKDFFALEDGWVPDFWAHQYDHTPSGTVFLSTLIEYKPGDVTETYKEELLVRFLEFWPDGMRGIMPALICGTPFDKSRPRLMYRMTWIGGIRWVRMERAEAWFFKNWDKAMETRFDLKDSRNNQPFHAQPLTINLTEPSKSS
jgi:hypothetical protein